MLRLIRHQLLLKLSVESCSSVFEKESYAAENTSELLLNLVHTGYFCSCESRQTTENVYVFCDCSRAIGAVVNISSLYRYPDIFRSLQSASKTLHDMSVVVHLINKLRCCC